MHDCIYRAVERQDLEEREREMQGETENETERLISPYIHDPAEPDPFTQRDNKIEGGSGG